MRSAYLWLWVLIGIFATRSNSSYGDDPVFDHDEQEENVLIEFAANHPEINISTYVTNGELIIRYATLRNYTNFLSNVEETRGAISAYTLGEYEPSLLDLAMSFHLQGAIDYLSSVRPDWVFEGSNGPSSISSAMQSGDVVQVEKFLNLGVDVNAYRGAMGFVWMDIACSSSLDMYELLRSCGARFGWPRSFSAERRQELHTKYSGEILNLYSNALVLPGGAQIDFVMDSDGETVSESSLSEIEGAITTAGESCKGTVLIVFHTPNAEPVGFNMEDIVDRTNVAIVRIPVGQESSPETWPMEYLPYVPPPDD